MCRIICPAFSKFAGLEVFKNQTHFSVEILLCCIVSGFYIEQDGASVAERSVFTDIDFKRSRFVASGGDAVEIHGVLANGNVGRHHLKRSSSLCSIAMAFVLKGEVKNRCFAGL